MRSNTQKLQAGYARKRETENQRYERTNEVNRYYDHWGKVTTRFQNWTKPEYYKDAENLLNKSKEKELKEKALNVKRQKLKSMLTEEKISYENELKFIMERKSSNLMLKKHNLAVNSANTISTDVLEKIDKNFKSEERRRLELEAKLYNQWRNPTINCNNNIGGNSGINSARSNLDEHIFLESKTDNEAMAKLNWLDKQIENQMRREQEQKETEMRNLRLQEEARQREETLFERQKIRESEIKELRAIQESHVHELKQRELEANNLKEDEIHLKNILDSLKSELLSLNERNENKNIEIPHNVNKIKMIFRQCSEYYRTEIKKDIECLSSVSIIFGINDENLQNLLKRFQSKLEIEHKNQHNIELMYESEAKQILNKWNEIWRQELVERHIKLRDFLNTRKRNYELQLNENLERQKKLLDIREKHLSGVENSNDKLKILIKEKHMNGIEQNLENENDNNNVPTLSLNESVGRCSSRLSAGQYGNGRSQDSVAAILSSSGNCDNNNSDRNNLLDLKEAQKVNNYCNIGDSLSKLCVPKFGRRKIAWL